MPVPPSHIFVVRHGNRLDAADKKWHLSSPTPYDPPLTYGGFQQARQVGNQIWSILEQAKLEYDVANEGSDSPKKRRRFKIVIHSSPFLRCVQTSIGISSGLAQAANGSIYIPSDVVVPPAPVTDASNHPKTAILRLDSFLGEWLSPEYFEAITPPPGPALMMGGAKAELLRRSDYSEADNINVQSTSTSTGALWNGSAGSVPSDTSVPLSEPGNADGSAASAFKQFQAKQGYVPPRPNYAASSVGKIPDGFVAHARDACLVVDYQWDSMRAPLDFGDGGKLGEEWPAMHKRFRKGLKQLVNWYCTDEAPAEPVSNPVTPTKSNDDHELVQEDEDVQTVVVLVSHGAGCNALMGAITHQPVLMDVGIASITMAERRPGVDYEQLRTTLPNDATAQYGVPVDRLYDIKLSASMEHLQSTASNPSSARSTRSSSIQNVWNGGSRGRTSTFGSIGGAVMSPFKYSDSLSSGGSRSASASATAPPFARRNSAAQRGRPSISATVANSPPSVPDGPATISPVATSPSFGLWSPVPTGLRLIEDDSDSDGDDLDHMLPNFSPTRFKAPASIETRPAASASESASGMPVFEMAPPVRTPGTPTGPVLSAPIKLQTSLAPAKPFEEVKVTPLGDGFGGLWSLPRPPDDAERFRDLSQSKRRWTVNERAA